MSPVTRTADEVLARLREIRAQPWLDALGWRAEVLAEFLDLDRLRSVDLVPLDVAAWQPRPVGDAARLGATYLTFAFGKALGHRGLSAWRSAETLAEYAWLQGRGDVVAAMADAPHGLYGVPKLLAYARAFDLPVPDDERLYRMGRGEVCDPAGCAEGCET